MRVLAIASGGGHWVQLLRLRPTLDAHDAAFATVRADYAVDVAGRRFYTVPDATRWSRLALLRCALAVAWVVLRERPDVVISTGAAPGYFALRLGRWIGARTVWIDSIANVEQISRAGELARPHADLWLTQWPHLAREGGPRFAGAVL